jgi:hypothetical protein
MRHHPVVAAFHKTCRQIPAYQALLREIGLNPADVNTPEDFARLAPVLNWSRWSGRFGLPQTCVHGRLGLVPEVQCAGATLAVVDSAAQQRQTEQEDAMLDALFAVRNRRTLLVELGASTWLTRRCTLARCGGDESSALSLLSHLGPSYEQVVLCGKVTALKSLLEQGALRGMWGRLNVRVLAADLYLSDCARQYFEHLLDPSGAADQQGQVLAALRIPQLSGLALYELGQLATLRRALADQPVLRQAMLGAGARCAPLALTYDPNEYYFEEVAGELVVTTLADRAAPLVRMGTGLSAVSLHTPANVRVPGVPLELLSAVEKVITLGPLGQVDSAGGALHAWQVADGLYADWPLASQITGRFDMRLEGEQPSLTVELLPGTAPTVELARQFAEAMAHFSDVPVEVAFGGRHVPDGARQGAPEVSAVASFDAAATPPSAAPRTPRTAP